ncbi:hypothetical protein EZV62_001480 [Acer yangbiense]|uniref:Uncharacterized protein n=1 Tax=Acer yangbiense TaxID=1000413 RepID=A0A5C7IUF0_9ROSI|nr:hypothetical protein EZV62_001480 [Acer yangbiense]
MWVSRLKSLRLGSVISGVANILVVIVGGILVLIAFPSCDANNILPILAVSSAAAMKILIMIKTGFAQEATAKTILESPSHTILSHQRRMRYKTWLWWTRFAIVITVFQLVGATFLMINMAKLVSNGDPSTNCVLGVASSGIEWKRKLLLIYLITVCSVALLQCFTGTDILRWRSFYESHDEVWKAHYQEVFDYGIRELMCCFGRVEYLTASEEDEICSVARLLGDLVAYRASGTGHLQLLAGKGKPSHLLGTGPKKGDPKFEAWDEADSMVMSWLWNSMIPEINDTCMFLFTAKDILESIRQTYAQVYEIKTKTASTKQGNSSVIEYANAWIQIPGKDELPSLNEVISMSSISYEGLVEAPEERLQGAAAFYKFAEASYTGPLLDVGRNPILFPCAWLLRQGVLTPWSRNRRPKLDGDNWWRGHAAAFLKYINLSRDVLREGRVCQDRCKAAYFILVLHHLRSVVIAVRGTETPEDLITDGLGKECILSTEDLDGSSLIHPDVKKSVESSFPHYGHSGIVEAARELFMQVEGNPRDDDPDSTGFLSSLLGAGCECDGYNVQIVGHSLGGAIAALLGLRLYGRFPNLHVYTYGPLPCVDSVVANACTEFVTSIVYDNEFSARLSVGSILRLRASALMALSNNTKTETALIFRLACQFLYMSKGEISKVGIKDPAENDSGISTTEDLNEHICGGSRETGRDFSLWNEADSTENAAETDDNDYSNPFHEIVADLNSIGDPVSDFMDTVSRSGNRSAGNPTEVFLPGLIIHIVPQRKNLNMPLWKTWRIQRTAQVHKAYIANRESFTDIVVSPSMFLDHLPWRCYNAIQKVLEARNGKHVLDESEIV